MKNINKVAEYCKAEVDRLVPLARSVDGRENYVEVQANLCRANLAVTRLYTIHHRQGQFEVHLSHECQYFSAVDYQNTCSSRRKEWACLGGDPSLPRKSAFGRPRVLLRKRKCIFPQRL